MTPVLMQKFASLHSTEQPEAVTAGTVKLVGTCVQKITGSLNELLTNEHTYSAMSNAHNPYGDGKACQRIVEQLADHFHLQAVAHV